MKIHRVKFNYSESAALYGLGFLKVWNVEHTTGEILVKQRRNGTLCMTYPNSKKRVPKDIREQILKSLSWEM